MAKLAIALALLDLPVHAVKGGQLIEADSKTIDQLQKAGEVDPHKDAVAYAKSQGAPVVRSCIEVAAEKQAAAIDALRVDIAKAEALAEKAEGDTKAALLRDVETKRAELAALEA